MAENKVIPDGFAHTFSRRVARLGEWYQSPMFPEVAIKCKEHNPDPVWILCPIEDIEKAMGMEEKEAA